MNQVVKLLLLRETSSRFRVDGHELIWMFEKQKEPFNLPEN